MLEAMGNGSSDAACLLYDLLSDKGPSSTMSLVMEGLERFSEEGSTAAMVRLGDALSRGALAEKDLRGPASWSKPPTSRRLRIPAAA